MRVISPENMVPSWWLPLLGSTCATLLVLVILLLGELAGPTPPPGRDIPVAPLGEADGAVHLAGTGTWLPLARRLAAAYESAHPDRHVVVHQSIGSGGGRQAVTEGAIDIGLVSTGQTPAPTLECCDVLAVARAAIVFAVHPTVRETSVTSREVVDIFSGRMTSWADGETIVPLIREEGDSSTRTAESHIPGLAEAIATSRRESRWQPLLTDAAMGRALEQTPESIGLFDLGAIVLDNDTLRPLALDGVTPSLETIADGRYPLTRTLVVYFSHTPRAPTRAFVDYLETPEARAVILAGGGYLPLEEGAP